MIVLREDLPAEWCNGGLREWFAANRLDWRKFLREGAPADVLLATGDPRVEIAVENAKERHGR